MQFCFVDCMSLNSIRDENAMSNNAFHFDTKVRNLLDVMIIFLAISVFREFSTFVLIHSTVRKQRSENNQNSQALV